MLTRIQNAFASALSSEKKGRLPTYVVVVLDDDFISFLGFEQERVTTLLGTWVEWIAKELNETLQQRLDQLPGKCKKDVFFYWVNAPTHGTFSKNKNSLRTKFNLSLESVIRTHNNMHVVRLKHMWNPKDSTLVVNDRITESGLTAYWDAVDASVRFNVQRREAYLAKQAKIPTCMVDNPTLTQGSDPMMQFF